MYNREHERQYEDWHRYGRERGFFDRAADEVRSWFGDEDAEQRRRMDSEMRQSRSGWGSTSGSSWDREDSGSRRHGWFDRDRDREYNDMPAWHRRDYGGGSPRGSELEARGRYDMEFGQERGGMRGGMGRQYEYGMDREHGGMRREYGMDREYGGTGRESGSHEYRRAGHEYGMFEPRTTYGESRFGQERYGQQSDWQREQKRGGLGSRFYDRSRERDFESGMGWQPRHQERDWEREQGWNREGRMFGGQRGSFFGGRQDYTGTSPRMLTGERGGFFGGHERGGMFGGDREEGGLFRGRGPRNYQRSDERISDEICRLLTMHSEIDASEMEVLVEKGIVTLRGKVDNRMVKRLAEDVCEDVYGVREVHNELRVENGLFQRGNEQQNRGSLLNR